jgi:hypothetical protein
MSFFSEMNARVKRFGIVDLKLAQFIGIFAALIIAKLVPQIMDISIWWFIILLVLVSIRPLYILLTRS